MFKILFYIILFMFAYRVLKKLFLPAAYSDAANSSKTSHQQNTNRDTYYQGDKSREIEDVDYEEVD